MKKLLIYCMLFLSLATGVSAQSVRNYVTVTGMVVDKESRKSMEFVYVGIIPMYSVVYWTVTDIHGMFKIRVPAGSYVLITRAYDYYDKKMMFQACKDVVLEAVEMQRDTALWGHVKETIIEGGPDGGMYMKIDGVNVKVR